MYLFKKKNKPQLSHFEIEKIIDLVNESAKRNQVPLDFIYEFSAILRKLLLEGNVKFIKLNESTITCHFEIEILPNSLSIPMKQVLRFSNNGYFPGRGYIGRVIGNGSHKQDQTIKEFQEIVKILRKE